MKARVLLEGAGAAVLFTIGVTWNQISPYHTDFYHRLLPITTVVRAITIYLVMACILCIALLVLLERFDRNRRSLLWAVFFAAAASSAIHGLVKDEVITSRFSHAALFFLVLLAAMALLWLFRRDWYSRTVHGICGVLLLLGFCIFWMLPQLVYLSAVRQPHEVESFYKPVPHVPRAHRRVVWLLFDELSYDQVYEHRQPGLRLPNFDRLRSRSVVFSDMRPQGYYTQDVIPALFTGKDVKAIRSSVTGQLFFRVHGSGRWQAFQADQTLFGEAQRRHWTTGILGTYNPYCRILAGQLDSCQSSLNSFDDHLSARKSTLGNLKAPFEAAWDRLVHRPFEVPPTVAQKYDSFVTAANALIRNEDVDFVFIHLPVPHPPGFYNRRTHKIAPGGSYLDNLALADDTLGKLLDTLDQTRSAGMTTLIVSSDHSWRVPMWRNTDGWTKEDERASQGRFDPRPTLVVHFPGETEAKQVSRPVPLLSMYDLLGKILQGGVDSPPDLDLWLEKMPSTEH